MEVKVVVKVEEEVMNVKEKVVEGLGGRRLSCGGLRRSKIRLCRV